MAAVPLKIKLAAVPVVIIVQPVLPAVPVNGVALVAPVAFVHQRKNLLLQQTVVLPPAGIATLLQLIRASVKQLPKKGLVAAGLPGLTVIAGSMADNTFHF